MVPPLSASAMTVGPYAVLSPLGRGAQASVYAARRAHDGLALALKVFDVGASLHEGALAAWRAAPPHPHLVSPIDAGVGPDGRLWVAMEHLRGETLAARLSRGPLGAAAVVSLGAALADGLAAAHGRGVAHGDVKPANIFLCDGPALHPRLLDFGLAARIDDAPLRDHRYLVGTPAYLSPERARGGDAVTAADDVWALAATLWECLTGVPVFLGPTLATTLYRAAFWEPPPLARARPDAPDGLCRAIAAALEKPRARRLTDAAALRRTLASLAHEPAPQPVEAPAASAAAAPPSAPSLSTPFVGRARELAALAATTAASFAGATNAAALVMGPRGLGKSRILHEASARALRHVGACVLVAQGATASAAAPFAPLVGALTQAAPDAAAELRSSVRSGDVQAAVDRARATFEDALEALSRQGPVTLIIDDAHRLDEGSRRLVRAVFHERAAPPAALWLAGPPEALDVLCDLARSPAVLTLSPLSEGETRQLARALAPEQAASLAARCEGNPLFLEALARAAGEGALPATIMEALRASLDALPAAARDFVACASVYGQAAWVEGVAALGADSTALPVLLRAGVLDLSSSSRLAGRSEVRFRSALTVGVARALQRPADLADRHRLAAAWLAAHHDADPGEVARLYDAAEARDDADAWWTRAVEAAAAAGIVEAVRDGADRVLRRASSPALRWRVLVAHDDALQQAGDRSAQGRVLDALAPLADALGPLARCELMWRRCHYGRMVGDAALATASGRASIEAAGPSPNRWSVAARVELALLYADRKLLAAARAEAEAARAEAPPRDAWLAARADHALAYVTLEEGRDYAAGLALYHRAAQGYRSARDGRRESIALVNGAVALIQLGRYGEAIDAYDDARALAARVGNARAAAVCLEGRGSVRRCLGELDGADEDLCAALAEARRLAHPRLAEAAEVERAYVALARGDDPERLRARAAALGPIGDDGLAALTRLTHACGSAVAALAERARAKLPALAAPLARFELAVAVCVVEGAAADDVRAARAALSDCVAGARDAADAQVRRRGLLRRFLVPHALEVALTADSLHPSG